MGNPRVAAVCTRCGFERLHYTRSDGSTVRPCMVCSRQLARERTKARRDDQDYRATRRQQWTKYNGSEKGRARLRRYRKLRQAANERAESARNPVVEAEQEPDDS